MTYDYQKLSPLTHLDRRFENATPQYLQRSDAFRVLKVHPGPQDAEIKCNLLIRRLKSGSPDLHTANDLQDPEDYDAVSYHWGDRGGNCSVTVLDGGQAFKIKIRRDLDSALRAFRSDTADVYLWVDAICIDQRNNDEKSAQIPLLPLIYDLAKVVRVWLGPTADESDKAMDFVAQCLDMERFDRLVSDPEAAQDWAALLELMRRPWFSRRWIIQEVASARTAIVHCGSKEVSWWEFASVTSMLPRHQATLRQLFRQSRDHKNHPDYFGNLSELGAVRLADVSDNLFRKLEDGTITEKLFSLEELISSLAAFEASNPHDILYAILWLANDAHPVTKNAFSIDVQQIYQNLQPSTPIFTASPVTIHAIAPSPLHNPDDHRDDATSSLLRPSNPPKRQRSWSDLSVLSNTSAVPNYLEVQPPVTVNVTAPDMNVGAEAMDEEETGSIRSANSSSRASGNLRLEGDSNSVQRADSSRRLGAKTNSYTSNSSGRRSRGSALSISTAGGQENRDKLAGARFLEKLQGSRITVDYNKTWSEVCRDFVNFTIARSSTLDMICKPWAPKDPQAGEALPSWISQLSGRAFAPTRRGIHQRVNADSLVGQSGSIAGSSKNYRASRRLPVERCPEIHVAESLVVRGFVLDIVRDKKASARAGVIPAEWTEACGWHKSSLLPPALFWKTLVGNRDQHGKLPPPYWQISCKHAFSKIPDDTDLNIEKVLLDCPSGVGEFLERVQCVVWNRRLVLLEALTPKAKPKALCIAPMETKKGDLVCILHGCSVPVILRRVDGRDKSTKGMKRDRSGTPLGRHPQCLKCGLQEPPDVYYKMVGECYVHGMMDGEAFRTQRHSKIKSQWFDLR